MIFAIATIFRKVLSTVRPRDKNFKQKLLHFQKRFSSFVKLVQFCRVVVNNIECTKLVEFTMRDIF